MSSKKIQNVILYNHLLRFVILLIKTEQKLYFMRCDYNNNCINFFFMCNMVRTIKINKLCDCVCKMFVFLDIKSLF